MLIHSSYTLQYRLAVRCQSTFTSVEVSVPDVPGLTFRQFREFIMSWSLPPVRSFNSSTCKLVSGAQFPNIRWVCRLACAFTLASAFSGNSASSEDWSSLQGRIVYSGAIPDQAPLVITRDEEVCGEFGLLDETLIVNRQNRGLQNVVVWLSSKTEVPVHPSLADASKPVQLDNNGCRFLPRIVPIRTGQVLQCTNADPVSHNVAVYARRNQPFSIIVPQGEPLERTFRREELKPIRVDCSIHAWMRAYLVVTEHPYAAVTDKNGRFSIKNVPQGKWQFRFWHETSDYLKTLTHGTETMELTRGTWELDVNNDKLELGDLTVDDKQFLTDQ
jgi:plastocyanin